MLNFIFIPMKFHVVDFKVWLCFSKFGLHHLNTSKTWLTFNHLSHWWKYWPWHVQAPESHWVLSFRIIPTTNPPSSWVGGSVSFKWLHYYSVPFPHLTYNYLMHTKDFSSQLEKISYKLCPLCGSCEPS